ncbi:hypothetical protein RB195_014705 [Necator americanus]|uniref:Uncharacterized protein n=2 Tax=Necator americanus TaxID=51031 RepID=W2SIV8_NECAM|nr:hypothetical protein NECAME_15642 [Necator americanus]ETN68776.1 hypothetical protein NECAME_15642 [Necator americanus]
MSIDAEITRINEGIAKVHLALYKFDNQLDSILTNINGKLNDFDAGVNNAVGKVNGVGRDITNIFQHFPNESVYYVVLVLLIFTLNILCMYMIYYIYKWIVEREVRFDREVRRYRKKIYQILDATRTSNSLETLETPPPTYDEYVKTADLYVKYHRNGNYSTISALPK